MNLIFIYGPPASGKLTIANELAKKLDYKVYPNHEIIAHLAHLFPYDDERLSEYRRKLAREIRLDIFEQAADANVSFITTFGMSGKAYYDFFNDVLRAITAKGGNVHFVQLTPSKETVLERVESASRKNVKIDSREYLEKLISKNPDIFEKFPDVEHLSLDNTDLSAANAADAIISHYKLSR